MMWSPTRWEREDRLRREANVRRRAERMAAARAKGTHTKEEWRILFSLFGECVICGVPYESLHGGEPCKDHILPIRFEGCDCIGNIQPVCRNCNSRKVCDTDFRNIARPDWATEFTKRLAELE
jgi:5-methylcytosine-specific restriction endonuclease McrA